MKITYYPGCTLSSTAFEYGDSAQTVMKALGVDVQEIPDWNCCGAASAKSLDHRLSILIPARNIRNAASLKNDIYIPCAGCYNNMMKAKRAMEDPATRPGIEKELKCTISHVPDIFPLMNVFLKDELRIKISALKKNIAPLKIAVYYGCAFLRPEEILKNENPELPHSLDILMRQIGLSPVEWPLKTFCCGGDLSLADSKVVTTLVDKLVTYAQEAGAEALVTGCPLCQANLEMRQTVKMPVFYFTELMGVAFGIDKDLWWKKHIVDPSAFVKKMKTDTALRTVNG